MDSPSIETADPAHALSNLEASRLEIFFLATGIFILVVQLALILWVGVKRLRKQVTQPNPHGRVSQPCLWKDIFPNPPRHDLGIMAQGPTEEDRSDESSFMEQVRKRSGSDAGAVKHELSDLRRKITVTGGLGDLVSTSPGLTIVDVEAAIATGIRMTSSGHETRGRRESAAT